MDTSDPLSSPDRHAFGQHSQGELRIGDIDCHIAKWLGSEVCKADAAVFALPSLLALQILALAGLSLVLACWRDHRIFPSLGRFARMILPQGIQAFRRFVLTRLVLQAPSGFFCRVT